MEEQIVTEVKRRKLKHVSLIGHSMGGGLAMAIAAHYPDLVDRVIRLDFENRPTHVFQYVLRLHKHRFACRT